MFARAPAKPKDPLEARVVALERRLVPTSWTTFTPTWTATSGTPVIGNGTLTGRYLATQDWCYAAFYLVFGSTTNHDTSTDWFLTLPLTADSSIEQHGQGYVVESGTFFWVIMPVIATATPTKISFLNHESGGNVGGTVPFTWGDLDRLSFSISYKRS